MMTHYALVQDPAREIRDAITQQVRDQIRIARQEALDARTARTAPPPSTPALPGAERGTIQQIPFDPNNNIPTGAVDLGIAFFVTVGAILIFWPLMRALARRMEQGSTVQRVPAEISSQLNHLSQAVDAIALEVERISEGQRFTTRLLSEQRGDASKTLLAPGAGSGAGERSAGG